MGTRWLASAERFALFVLPPLGVLVVAFAVLVAARPRPVVGVRARGGPTEHAAAPSLRLEVVRRVAEVSHPLRKTKLRVEAERGQARVAWSGVLDDEGAAYIELPGLTGSGANLRFRAWLPDRAEPLADAVVAIPRARWSDVARRRGGWVDGPPKDGLIVRAAAERGVFAVPFADGLWVEVRRGGIARPGATVEASGDGAEVEPARAVTSERGAVRLRVRPLEHGATLTLVARDADGAEARLELSPAIVPGALRAELAPGAISIESPILRSRAYVAVVTGTDRLWGAAVDLVPTDGGGAAGTIVPRDLPATGPIWAVVSSEPELGSGSTVGWSLRGADPNAPEGTFDVPDVLWFDSTNAALAGEASRARRVRTLAALFAALSLGVTSLLVLRRTRRSRTVLSTHLADAGSDADDAAHVMRGGGTWLALAAVLCFALGALLVAMFATWR